MPVHNSDVADIFNELADLLEIQSENPFKIRAYRNAARTVSGLAASVVDMIERGDDLTRLPGIGKDLAAKIVEIARTGGLQKLADVRKRTPGELSRMMKVGGLGPRRVKALYEHLGIQRLADLKKAAAEGRIKALPGFGEKTERKILEEMIQFEKGAERVKLVRAEEIARPLVAYLRRAKDVRIVEIAGSFRRRSETVGDLDLLATCGEGSDIMESFTRYEDVKEVVAEGPTKSSVVLRSGLHVDLRVVADESYGAALQYFTGSKAHSIALRTLAVKRKLKINEYGVFRGKRSVASRTEAEVYRQVGLPYIEPELREDRGEIEAAQEGRLPNLVSLKDIRGDLHVHSKASDGRNSLEEMARAARAHGYEYITATDHSRRITIARGLDARRLREQVGKIDDLNAKLDGIVILKSIEVDILEDGSLDLPDDVLALLDFTVCAVHSKFNLSREKQTERIIRAMDHPAFTILAHPTGRLINEREPYDVDMEALIEAARQRGCFLELSAQPDRLDLTDVHCRAAKEAGMKVAISTDAHGVSDLDFMRFGIDQARRGWLEPEDVLNTRGLRDLRKMIKR